MIVAVADTHAAIWYLFSDPRLSGPASTFIENTIRNGNHIGVSAITLAEMVYLIERGRIPANALADLHRATFDPNAILRHVPFDENIALKMADVPRQELPDLPDRVIAATACFLNVPVLSRYRKIRTSTIQSIW